MQNMKKSISRKVYNTDTAELIKTNNYGEFGDPAGYQETLYKTPKGDYFIYGVGGAESKYPAEDIVTVTPEEAEQF